MPRYYVDVIRQDGTARDEEGQVFDDPAAVRDDAMRTAKQMAAESLRHGERLSSILESSIVAHDGAGHIVLTLSFAEAVETDNYAP